MKVLCVSHSSRPFFEAQCSLNFLGKRFKTRESMEIPQIGSFESLKKTAPYDGELTLWKIESDSSLTFLEKYKPDYKVQSATFHSDRLLVYGSDRLEILDTEMKCISTITGPHMAGGHTVYVDHEGYAWVTSAPGDLILKIDIQAGKIVNELFVPDFYGPGVKFGDGDDFKEHYISTDYQRTHLNSAIPFKDRLLITLWKQGVVGELFVDGRYRELVKGYTGCHGGRFSHDMAELYLTDSSAGIVWFFDSKNIEISGRFKCDSLWVHDAVQISGELYVAGVSDKNCLQVFSREKMDIVYEEDCSPFGSSVMLLNCCNIDEKKWQGLLSSKNSVNLKKKKFSENLVPLFSNTSFWKKSYSLGLLLELDFEQYRLSSVKDVKNEYLLESNQFKLWEGSYQIEGRVFCHKNRGVIGVLDVDEKKWVTVLVFDESVSDAKAQFHLRKPMTLCSLVVSAFAKHNPEPIDISIRNINLRNIIEKSNTEDNYIENEQNFFPHVTDKTFWKVFQASSFVSVVKLSNEDRGMKVISRKKLSSEYLIESRILEFSSFGVYKVSGDIRCQGCSISVGFLDVETSIWLGQLIFSPGNELQTEFINVTSRHKDKVKIVVSAANSGDKKSIIALIKELTMTCIRKEFSSA